MSLWMNQVCNDAINEVLVSRRLDAELRLHIVDSDDAPRIIDRIFGFSPDAVAGIDVDSVSNDNS